VDRTEALPPVVAVPAVGRQLLVSLDRQRDFLASSEVFDDIEVEAIPEVPAVARPLEFPRSPRGDLLVGATDGLLEQAGDSIAAVAAVGLVGLLRFAEVVFGVGVGIALGVEVAVAAEGGLPGLVVGHTGDVASGG